MRYASLFVVIALTAIGCDFSPDPDHSGNNHKAEYEQYRVGTMFSPPIFSRAFNDGHIELDEYGYKYEFHPIEAGLLGVPSGKLVIDEPLYFNDQEPMDISISPGIYPVIISEALVFKDGKVADKRNAFAKIVIRPGEAESWEYIWSFGVDGGTGGYIDYQVMKEIIANNHQEQFSTNLLNEFEANYKVPEPFHENHDSYHQYVTMAYGSGNLIAFSSGWGDGGYNSYIGYDSNGTPVEVLTDLGIVFWEAEEHLISKGTGHSQAAPAL